MIAILSFLFLVMGLFLRSHNSQIKGTTLIAAATNTKDSAIYYDKINKTEKAATKSYCCGLYKRRVAPKKDNDSDSSDLDQTNKTEYSVKYKDLEVLLADFNRA